MKKELTLRERSLIADLLTNWEVVKQEDGKFRGKEAHSRQTVISVVGMGYAEIKNRTKTGDMLTIIPTERAIYLIPVNL